MIGVIDIGNTLIHCCLEKDKKIIERKNFSDLNGINDFFKNVEKVLIISNSEEKRENIRKELKEKKIYNFPIERIKRNYYGKVGEDRLAAAFYIIEKSLFPAIIIDAGTAITIDLVDKKGVFSGGAILPGIKVFFKSYEEIGTLRFLEKELKPRKATGKDTKGCISLGLHIYINGIKKYIKNKKVENVFLTGGDADIFKEKKWKKDRDLVLKGGIYAFYKFFA